MRLRLFPVVLALLMAVPVAPDARAQHRLPLSSSTFPQAWISAGMGLGAGVGPVLDGTAGVSLQAGLPRYRLVGQVGLNGQWTIESATDVLDLPYANSIHAAVGKARAGKHGSAAVFAGPALAWGRTRAGGPLYHAPGLALSTQLTITPTRTWGAGFDVLAVFTPQQSRFGLRLAFQLGSARRR